MEAGCLLPTAGEGRGHIAQDDVRDVHGVGAPLGWER